MPTYTGKPRRLGYNWGGRLPCFLDLIVVETSERNPAPISVIVTAQLRQAASIARINEFVDIFLLRFAGRIHVG